MNSAGHIASTLPADFVEALQQCAGPANVLLDIADRLPYGYDNSRRQQDPDVVVFATDHAQIRDIVRLCNRFRIPLVARGRGTGTTGATVPVRGGLVLSLERMQRILRIDPANRLMVVEPGVTNQMVQNAAAKVGFFWPPDPTSAEYCTIGGNLAYNSAGPRAVKYGTPRDNTLGLSAITGDGKEIRTGVYTTKGVIGYDLTRLLIGSEGTLAIITQATLKLTPLAQAKQTMQVLYRDIHSAAAAVSSIMAQAVTPCSLEFIDSRAIEMIRDYSDIELPDSAGAMLMIEVDGPESCLALSVNAVSEAANNQGMLSLRIASSADEARALWQIRKALSPALRKIAPKKINEDVVVPVSNIPALIEGLEQLSGEYGISIVNFGHAGNGNIHVNLLINPDDPVQAKNADACLSRVFDLVLSLQGTLSGEHGVGLVKREFVNREIDPVTMDLMRRLKREFDPNNILNPDKMFPAID